MITPLLSQILHRYGQTSGISDQSWQGAGHMTCSRDLLPRLLDAACESGRSHHALSPPNNALSRRTPIRMPQTRDQLYGICEVHNWDMGSCRVLSNVNVELISRFSSLGSEFAKEQARTIVLPSNLSRMRREFVFSPLNESCVFKFTFSLVKYTTNISLDLSSYSSNPFPRERATNHHAESVGTTQQQECSNSSKHIPETHEPMESSHQSLRPHGDCQLRANPLPSWLLLIERHTHPDIIRPSPNYIDAAKDAKFYPQ